MSEIKLPEYGEKLRATSQLVRKMRIDRTERGQYIDRKTVKYWHEQPFDGEVIYLGTRQLQNGTREYDSEYGCYFIPTEYIKAALVSPGPRLNPIYVPIDGLVRVEEE